MMCHTIGLIVTLALSFLGASFAVAQPPVKAPQIWVLSLRPLPHVGPDARLLPLRQELRRVRLGRGQSLVIEERWVEWHSERLPEFVTEVVWLPVNVIITAGKPAIRVAQHAPTMIPIIFWSPGASVESVLV